eukprot:scaffold9305_cov91-Isochrysis_galbana.AAC.4
MIRNDGGGGGVTFLLHAGRHSRWNWNRRTLPTVRALRTPDAARPAAAVGARCTAWQSSSPRAPVGV